MDKANNTGIFENLLGTFWLDEDGILNTVAKPTDRPFEDIQLYLQQIRKSLGGEKAYLISDVTSVREITDETYEYYKKEFPSLFKALALVASTDLGRMLGKVMHLIFNPTIPTKVFTNADDARAWLKELRENGIPILPPEVVRTKVKGKLLLIDDNPVEEKILRYAIEEGNWNVAVEFFSRPQKALEYLREATDEIFLIISDINMPEMNGFEFKSVVDGDNTISRKSIPFIFLSTSSERQDITKAYDHQVQGYFEKPTDLEAAKEMFDRIFKYWVVSRHPHKISY